MTPDELTVSPTKVRGDFVRLMADLEAGRFGAEILVLWEPSRGSRDFLEWALLVNALKDSGVKVFVTTHGRLYDCANHRDRRTLLEDAVDAAFQSDKASAAILRAAAAANRTAGFPTATRAGTIPRRGSSWSRYPSPTRLRLSASCSPGCDWATRSGL